MFDIELLVRDLQIHQPLGQGSAFRAQLRQLPRLFSTQGLRPLGLNLPFMATLVGVGQPSAGLGMFVAQGVERLLHMIHASLNCCLECLLAVPLSLRLSQELTLLIQRVTILCLPAGKPERRQPPTHQGRQQRQCQ